MRKKFDAGPALTREQISAAFDGRISKLAIRWTGEGWEIVGKFCYVSYSGKHNVSRLGKQWDVFICNPADISKGLSQRKVHNIVRNIEQYAQEGGFTILNGEAYAQGVLKDVILQNLVPLGIRRKKQFSAEQKRALAGRLSRSRRGAKI